jgi:diketogulonate reductase-like aldo/keto reductase
MQVVKIQDAQIPALGFGSYGMGRADMMRMIPAALRGGFRHIDTAQIYRNEQEVGECVASAAIPRREIFITTKVWVSNYPEKLFVMSVDESLKKLQTNYIDLLLLHWPSDMVPLAEQIGALNSVVRSGKARYIGVSNFNKALMAQAVSLSETPLVTNQVEYHPFLNQNIILEATAKCGPFAHRLLRHGDRPGAGRTRPRRDRWAPWPKHRPGRAALAHSAVRGHRPFANHQPVADR